MDARVLFFLVVLGTSWCCNARMTNTNVSPVQNRIASVSQINHQQREREVKPFCSLCVDLATPILEYMSKNMTQEELTSALHRLCSFTFLYKDKCDAQVDHYAPLIFNGTAVLTPEILCEQVGLCNIDVFVSQHLSENGCEFCHHAVTEALLKLKYPGSQLQIVKLLLKACNAVEGSVENCKRLVLADAHLIHTYAKQLLHRHDICTLLNACRSATNAAEKASSSETSMGSAY